MIDNPTHARRSVLPKSRKSYGVIGVECEERSGDVVDGVPVGSLFGLLIGVLGGLACVYVYPAIASSNRRAFR